MLLQWATAQPIVVVPFHTTCVKWLYVGSTGLYSARLIDECQCKTDDME